MTTVTGVNNIQYTAQFGNGVSGTIGLDDPTVFNRTSLLHFNAGVPVRQPSGSVLAGPPTPTAACICLMSSATSAIDQAWGLFQLSGAVHEVDASYNTSGADLGALPTLRRR